MSIRFVVRRKSDGLFYRDSDQYVKNPKPEWITELDEASTYRSASAAVCSRGASHNRYKKVMSISNKYGHYKKLSKDKWNFEVVEVEVTLRIRKGEHI